MHWIEDCPYNYIRNFNIRYQGSGYPVDFYIPILRLGIQTKEVYLDTPEGPSFARRSLLRNGIRIMHLKKGEGPNWELVEQNFKAIEEANRERANRNSYYDNPNEAKEEISDEAFIRYVLRKDAMR